MGIPTLNTFLQYKCKNSHHCIKCIHLEKLKGTKIAIDTSIYLYKFESTGNLIEQFYLLLILLKKYNITPLFVFDGKIPSLKNDVILKRRQEKEEAGINYNQLKDLINAEGSTPELLNRLAFIKKKMAVINSNKINKVKLLLTYFGACFIEAEGEADLLCVELVKHKIVYACLSEDMDMFAYGCPRILRYLSLVNHNIVLYDLSSILSSLQIHQEDLLDLCIVCGTDYNVKSVDKEKKFEFWYNKMMIYKEKWRKQTFIEWIIQEGENINQEKFLEIKNIFTSRLNMEDMCSLDINNGIMMEQELKHMLEDDGFIFE